MSAVQAGSGKSGQKPGSPAGGRPPKPAPGTRGASGATGAKQAPGRKPGSASKTGSGGRPAATGGGKGPKQPGTYRPGAKPPRRFSPSTIGFIAVAVVAVVIVVFVVVKITGKSTPGSGNSNRAAPVLTKAPASLLAQVTGVPTTVASAVGLPPTSTVNPPTYKKGEPKLTISGKPGAVFVGAEFCPYCAAERWSMIMAFSKFGTFSNLSETTSSPWDVYPATPTFSFLNSTYTSPYINFDFVEAESNDTGPSGGRGPLETPNAVESKTWSKYDSPEGFPFLDIGNKIFVTTGASYLPSTLAGLDQSDVASKLKNPKDPVTEAIVGTSNYLTAGICAITGQKPASACSPAVIGKAAKAMGLS